MRASIACVCLSASLLFIGCNKGSEDIVAESEEPVFEPIEEGELEIPDWTEATHSNDVDPDYAIVFPDDKVHRLDITISEANWSAMQSDLATNLTSSGGPGQGGADIDFTPVWVPCTFTFDGLDWYQVGIRYKGNSTLRNAYQGNSDKYPFKLDFDEFEDTYPDIKNQRFYGFKQLNLSSNYSDDSFMREKVAGDLFRSFGVVAPRASFCAVYLDRGNGSNFIGVYTLVEEVDDSVPDSQFPDNDGNLYKPDGDAATFASGTYDEDEMDLKTNEDEADYSDVRALYDLMQSSTRTSDETQWISDLEDIFNVDQYLKYLAVNTVIQNWDTYGVMTHNYFLYNDLGKLVWIPWDNNESMQDGKMGGAISLSMSEVTDEWPLIRYVMDVDQYETQYRTYVRDFTDNHFQPATMSSQFSTYESLLSDYAAQEGGNFSGAISTLNTHVQNRNDEVDNYLN
ncbi:MAG: CotH kinase family protein [Cyclobacteriaceae bacterium]